MYQTAMRSLFVGNQNIHKMRPDLGSRNRSAVYPTGQKNVPWLFLLLFITNTKKQPIAVKTHCIGQPIIETHESAYKNNIKEKKHVS